MLGLVKLYVGQVGLILIQIDFRILWLIIWLNRWRVLVLLIYIWFRSIVSQVFFRTTFYQSSIRNVTIDLIRKVVLSKYILLVFVIILQSRTFTSFSHHFNTISFFRGLTCIGSSLFAVKWLWIIQSLVWFDI